MKNCNKIIAFLLALIMFVSATPTTVFAAKPGETPGVPTLTYPTVENAVVHIEGEYLTGNQVVELRKEILDQTVKDYGVYGDNPAVEIYIDTVWILLESDKEINLYSSTSPREVRITWSMPSGDLRPSVFEYVDVVFCDSTNLTSSVTKPTCTEEGYTTYKCACSEFSRIENKTPALGHTWADATFDAPKTCTTCGATEGEALAGVAAVDGVKYKTLAEALEAVKEINGAVVVEIYDKATLSAPLDGAYSSITFVGKDDDAEIYIDLQGVIYATGKKVAFKDLKLSKVAGGYITDAGFMNLAFGVYGATEVTYTGCTFANGAYASFGKNTFTNCTFYRSHDRYGMWAYGADEVIVDGCTFADIRGIKLFDEGKERLTALTVKNTDFTKATGKPAIVLTSGKSVTLENNKYPSTGVLELDLDGVPNGTTITSTDPITCVNDNGACGVLVDGKIYTTVAQAAEVATSGSTVTLLHDSAETVELAAGVTLNKNGFESTGVTVAKPAPAEIQVSTLAELLAALADNSNSLPIVVTSEIKIPAGETVELDLNGKTVMSVYQTNSTDKHIYPLNVYGSLTIKDTKGNGSITGRGIFVQVGSKLTIDGGSIYAIDSNGGSALFMYGGDVVINGGHIEQKAEGTYNFAIQAPAGTVTVNGGWVGGNHGAIAATGGQVVINDGTLVCTGSAGMTDNVVYSSGDGSITINGGNFIADKDIPSGGCCVYDANGGVTINGGTFGNSSGGDVWGTAGTTIKGGTFEALTEKQHIADGYELGENGEVVKSAPPVVLNAQTVLGTIKVETVNGDNLAYVLGRLDVASNLFPLAGGVKIVEIEVNSDVVETETVTIKYNTVIRGTGAVSGTIVVNYGATLTVSDTVGIENLNIVDEQGNAIVAVDGVYAPVEKTYVASVNGVKYTDLQEAINAAQNGDTIVLLADLEVIGETFTIADGKSITLDMNGKKITATDNKAANVSYELFYIYGELTVTGNGTIELTSTSNDTAYAKSSTIFHNRGGVLTIKNGTFKHLGGTAMAYVVDNSANSFGDAYLYVNGGEIISVNYIAIRMRMEDPNANGNPGNGLSIAEVTGGYIYGANRGIWGQKSSGANEKQGELTVTGGVVENNRADRGAIQIDTDSYEAQNMLVSISGNATIKGAIKGGDDEFVVSGGIFTVAVPEKYCAEGFEPKANEDGTFGVQEAKVYVAEVNGVKYESLQAAIDAANGSTVTLLADVTVTETIQVNNTVTVDAGNYTLTHDASGFLFAVKAENITFTVKGGNFVIPASKAAYGFISLQANGTTLVVNGGTYTGNTVSKNSGLFTNYINDSTGALNTVFELNNVTANTDKRILTTWEYAKSVSVNGGTYTSASTPFAVASQGENSTDATIIFNGVTATSASGPVAEIIGYMGNCVAEFKECTITATGTDNAGAPTAAIATSYGATAVVTSGTYTGSDNTTNDGKNALAIYTTGGKFIVNGGTLNGGIWVVAYKSAYGDYAVDFKAGQMNGAFKVTGDGTPHGIAVSGGTFNAPVAEEFCAEGYIPTVNADGTYGVEVGQFVAQIGDVKFKTVADALVYAKAEGITDLVITLIGNTTKNSALALEDSFYMYGETGFNSVTFKQADNSAVYYIDSIYTGSRINGGSFIFDGVNIHVTGQYIFEGNVKLINNVTINCSAEANCFFYNCEVTIEAGSRIHGVIEDYRGGDVIVDGGRNDGQYNDTPALQDSIMHIRWSGDSLVIKNGGFVKVNAVNEVGRINLSTGTFIDVQASKLEAWEYIDIASGAELRIDIASLATTKNITGAGKIVINATGLSGNVQPIFADMSGFTGTIEIVGNDFANYKITANGVVVNEVIPVAKVGDQYFVTLAEAIAVANGAEIEILRDVRENMSAVQNVKFVTNIVGGVTITNTFAEDAWIAFNNVIVGSGVTLIMPNVLITDSTNVIEGTLITGATGETGTTYYQRYDAKTTVQNGGKIIVNGDVVLRYNEESDAGIYIYGDGNADTVEFSTTGYIGAYSGAFYAKKAVITTGTDLRLDYHDIKNGVVKGEEADKYAPVVAEFVNSTVNVTGQLRLYKDAHLVLNSSNVHAGTLQVRQMAKPVVTVDDNSALTADTVEVVTGALVDASRDDEGNVTFKPMVAQVGTKTYSDLNAAIAAAQAGETVKLLSDVVLNDTITIEKSITIDGDGYKLLPVEGKTYNSAIMAGNSGWGDNHGETIKLVDLDISGFNTNYGAVRAQGVTLEMTDCVLNENSVSNYAYAVVSLNYTNATISRCEFKNNNDRVIDVNYNGDSSQALVTIDGCTIDGNTTTDPGIVMRSAGKIAVKNSVFTNNTVNTSGNGATLYVGFGAGNEVSECTFAGNTVTTSHTTTKRFASAIFCDGCVVSENVFGEGNTAVRNGETISTVVAVGAYYGAADISDNYWGGDAPVAGIDYTIEYTRNEVTVDAYYADEELSNKVAINNVAKVGKYSYTSLAEAIAAANNGDTITLLADIAATDRIYVAGKTIILDLNGKVISGNCNASQSTLVYVENGAKLTVEDSVGTGKITYAQGTSNVGWTVDVKGEFVLESGTIELTGSWSIGYAVDVRPNSWGTAYTSATKFVMNGGTIISSDGGVRVASSSDAAHKNVSASFVMNGGKIDAAWDGVFIQQSDAIYDDLSFTINGGTIESDLNPVRVYGPAPTGYVNDQECMNITLAGGTMTYTGTSTQTWVIDGIFRVGGGNSVETILANGEFVVSAEVAQNSSAPEGFKWVETTGGYTLVECDYVAQIGDVKYESLAEAFAAVQGGQTIKLLADVALDATIVIDKAITLDLNGKTISCSSNTIMFQIKADTTIVNGKISGNKTGTSSGIIDIYANLTMNAVTVETTKIKAMAFKAGGYTAVLNNCVVTGDLKGYGGSVWQIYGGTYYSGSNTSTEHLNGNVEVYSGTFHYELRPVDCAPGYVPVNNGETWTVEYNPACFVDANNNGTQDEGEALFGTLEEIFSTYRSGDVYIVLLRDIEIENQVDTNVNAKYYLNAAEDVTVTFKHDKGVLGSKDENGNDIPAKDQAWNFIQNMYIGENVTLSSKYLLLWGDVEIAGVVNTTYLYTLGATVDVLSIGKVNVSGGESTVQVKANTTFTVDGELNATLLQVWNDNAKLVVNGVVKATSIRAWDGAPVIIVDENATVDGKVNLADNATLQGPAGLDVVTETVDHKVAYENGIYGVVECDYVVEVGGKKYESLQDAINAAQNGETVTLLAPITVQKGETLVIDLKGQTVSVEITEQLTKSYAMITNKGTLTITDSVGGGKLSLNYTAGSFGYGMGLYTISNEGGTLTIEGGRVENLATVSGSMYDAIDNNSTLGDTYLTISGGEIYCGYLGIRQFANSTTYENVVTVSGGKVEGGNSAIWMQNPGSNQPKADVVVTGGYVAGRILVYESTEFAVAVSGGTFTVAVLEEFCAEGYIPTANTDGTYGVKVGKYVAQVGDVKYESLHEAIAAAQNGDEIVLIADVALDKTLTVAGKTIILDLNGKVISGNCNASQSTLVYVENGAKLTVKDSVGTGKITYAQGTSNVGWTVDVKGEFVLESGTIELTGIWSIGYAVDVRPNSWGTAYTSGTKFVMNGGTIISSDGGVRVASSSDAAHKNVSASFVMNGGKIDAAWDGVFIQQSDAIYDDLSFTINGGTIESDLNPVRVYGPAPTGYVNDQECMNITLAGGTMTYTGTSTQTWVIDGIFRVGGGSSTETILDNGAIVVSEEIAESTAPDGFKWIETTGGYTLAACEYVAQIGNVKYESLQDAINAAQNGETIVLLADLVVVGETFTIADGKSVIFDMNGKKITATDNKAANVSYELFYIYGELTVTGNGTIEMTSTSNDTAWAKSSTIFHNRGGVLTIENGTFTHLGGTAMAYVVDNNANSYGDATTNIKDGTLSSTYVAIRNRMDTYGANGGGNGIATLNISGGSLAGKYAVWGHVSSSGAKGQINISGGTFTAAEGKEAVRVGIDATGEIETAISGGTFSSAVSEGHCVEGYIPTVNDDGTYGVKVGKFVARNDTTGTSYETFADAIEAANNGDTITILVDGLDIGDINKNVTIVKGTNAVLVGTLSAGTYDWDVSGSCAVGTCAKNNGDGTWTVSAHIEETIPAIAPTLDTPGYSEGKKCSACGEILVEPEEIPALNDAALIKNDGTSVFYEKLADALVAAQMTGGTIKLLRSATTTILMVPAGVTLNLNGYYVTAGNVLSFGNIIDKNGEEVDGLGGIKITNDRTQAIVQLQQNNTYLPLYDSANGCYRFFAYELVNKGSKVVDAETNEVKFGFAITFNNTMAYTMLKDTDNSGVTFVIEFNWTGKNSDVVYTHVFSVNSIEEYASGWEQGSKKVLEVTISGLDSLESGAFISATFTVSSETGVTCANAPIVRTLA